MKLVNCFVLLFVLVLSSCAFKNHANNQFGDQNFKSSIALIELYKTRNGDYPKSLKELEFLGSWDLIWLNSVTYKKLEIGYNLDLNNGWIGMPKDVTYPDKFWNGLGIIESNMKVKDDK